jgi:hypothetical protein
MTSPKTGCTDESLGLRRNARSRACATVLGATGWGSAQLSISRASRGCEQALAHARHRGCGEARNDTSGRVVRSDLLQSGHHLVRPAPARTRRRSESPDSGPLVHHEVRIVLRRKDYQTPASHHRHEISARFRSACPKRATPQEKAGSSSQLGSRGNMITKTAEHERTHRSAVPAPVGV